MNYMENTRKILEKEPHVVFAYLFGSYGKLLHSKDEKKRIDFETYESFSNNFRDIKDIRDFARKVLNYIS